MTKLEIGQHRLDEMLPDFCIQCQKFFSHPCIRMILENHDVECMYRLYKKLKEAIPCGYSLYEFTSTVDPNKQTWAKAERTSAERVKKILGSAEPVGWMMFQEHNKSNWIHFHGLVWFKFKEDSIAYLKTELKKKIGKEVKIDKLRDGYFDRLEGVDRKYDDWFGYISKDREKWWMSDCAFCSCHEKIFCCVRVEPNAKEWLLKVMPKDDLKSQRLIDADVVVLD